MGIASDDENENYWPGYVDALTTMTMVLTFILMVLGIVVFSLSQSVSRGYLEAIAKAANVAGNPRSQNVDALQAAIIERLQGLTRDQRQQSPSPPNPASGRDVTADAGNSGRESTAKPDRVSDKVVADEARGGPAELKLAEPAPVPFAPPTQGGVTSDREMRSGYPVSAAIAKDGKPDLQSRVGPADSSVMPRDGLADGPEKPRTAQGVPLERVPTVAAAPPSSGQVVPAGIPVASENGEQGIAIRNRIAESEPAPDAQAPTARLPMANREPLPATGLAAPVATESRSPWGRLSPT